MESVLLVFLTSIAVVLASTPSVISVAKYKNMFDFPSEKKLHKSEIPRIGGLAIFAAVLFSYSLWRPYPPDPTFRFILAALIILFFVGLKDDIVGISPIKKLAAQVLVAMIIVIDGEGAVRLTGMHGILGIYELPFWLGIILSVFMYIVITNSFNLVDGIDGLSAGLGLIASAVFGFWFYFTNNLSIACMAFALSGALLGILIFNFNPAKIFIGDSGSLIIGFLVALFAIRFIEINGQNLQIKSEIESRLVEAETFGLLSLQLKEFIFSSSPAFAMAVLIVPLYDTLRVFLVRIKNQKSPFQGDTNHIHHRLLYMGFNQVQTCYILFFITCFFIFVAYLLKDYSSTNVIFILLVIAIFFDGILFLLKRRKTKKEVTDNTDKQN